MKIIKFRESLSDDTFYQDLRKRVSRYLKTQHADGYATPEVWLKSVFYLLAYGGVYWLLITSDWSFPGTLLLWGILGVLSIAIGLNIAHDAAHDTCFKSKRLNKWLFNLTFNALGANGYLWKLRHVESHHLFPNVDNCDADIDDNPFIRLSPHQPLKWYHRYQYLYAPVIYSLYTLHWIFIKDFIILNKNNLANLRHIRHPKREVFLFFCYKILFFIILWAIPWSVGHIPAIQVAAGFLFMQVIASYTFIFGLIASHFADSCIFPRVDGEGYLDLSWSKHQVAASLDYHATARWANWIFGGFNAHVAHHLFPGVHHVHYPAISAIISEMAEQYRLPYRNTTLPGAIIEHFKYLKRMAK